MINGEWFRKSTKTSGRKKALEKEKEFRNEFLDTRSGLRRDITLGQAIDGFNVTKEGTPDYENSVHQGKVVKKLLGTSTDLQDITTAHITRLVTKLKKDGFSNSTIKHVSKSFEVRSNMLAHMGTLYRKWNIQNSNSSEAVLAF